MKNSLYLSLLAFSVFMFAGCQSFEDDDLVIPDPVVLPDLAADFIQTNYPDFQIQHQDIEDLCDNTEVLEVELEDGPEPDIDLYFSLTGAYLFSATEIMLDELPEAVRNTIDSAYASYIIDAESVERFDFPDGSVQYAVELIDVNSEEDYELVLAQDGTVVCWEEDHDDDDGNDDGNDDGSDTLTISIPDTVSSFISSNYEGYQIDGVESEDLCDDEDFYKVELEDGPGADIDLYFNLDWVFQFSATDISLNQIPAIVSDAIAVDYPNFQIVPGEAERLDYPNGDVAYLLEIESPNGDDREVLYAADGTLQCDDNDDDDGGNGNGNDDTPLPDGILDYINSEYPGYQIDGVENEDLCDDEDYFKVELEDGPGADIDLYFSLDWEFQFSATEISLNQIPAIVSDAIAVDYPNFQVVPGEAERLDYPNGDVAYLLEIESPNGDDREVLYAADGILQCDDNDDDDGGNGNGNDDTSLPDDILDYINSEYPGYQIDGVESEDLCDDEDYFKVELEDGPGADIDLYFSLDWEFQFSATEITASALPAAVTNALAVDYPGAQIESDGIERLDFPDGSVQYYLEVETSDEDYDLVYTSAGVLVCS